MLKDRQEDNITELGISMYMIVKTNIFLGLQNTICIGILILLAENRINDHKHTGCGEINMLNYQCNILVLDKPRM